MAKQQLDGAQVRTRFEQVDGKGVAQRVRCDRLSDAGPAPRLFTGVLHGKGRDRLIGDVAGKQEILRVDGRQYVLRTSSSLGESITQRSFCPLPSSTQMIIRWLSIAAGVRRSASEIRRPAA